MKGKLDHYLKCDSEDGGSFSSDSKDPLGEDQGESSGIGSNAEGFLETDEEREAQMSRKLRKINSASIFFHDVDIEEELQYDFDDEELEDLSEDEINFDTDHLLEQN